MSDDILEIKPGWGPFKLNLNALWRRLHGRAPGAAQLVAERFLQAFSDHGVKPSQIPRFMPPMTLATLSSPETLLTALTPDILDRTAQLFGVQRAWLEGATDRIYRTLSCYKQPEALFDLLGNLPFERGAFQVRALTSTKRLDHRSHFTQPLVLLIVEKLAPVDDIDEIWDIERYHIFGDAWDWAHPPCRIQLKAMVRVIDRLGHQPVPLFPVKPAQLQAVLSGRCVPKPVVNRCLLSDPSLEDYGSSASEHAQAKETDELPAVLDYIERHQLLGLWRQMPVLSTKG